MNSIMTPLTYLFVFLIGLALSSFFQLIGSRLPKKETLMGRSYCDQCHQDLRFIDVIPIIGYVINRRKCHSCHANIKLTYPITELIGGLAILFAYHIFGFSFDFLIFCILISVFIIESVSDILYNIVIDRIWIIGVIPLIIIRLIQDDFLRYLISSAVLFSFLYLIAVLGRHIFKKEALGGGDVKIYIFIGFILTILEGFLSLFIASSLGLVYGFLKKNKEKAIPLVPFISIGVFITFIWGEKLISWYLNMLGM